MVLQVNVRLNTSGFWYILGWREQYSTHLYKTSQDKLDSTYAPTKTSSNGFYRPRYTIIFLKVSDIIIRII